jgi:hypothetical protein
MVQIEIKVVEGSDNTYVSRSLFNGVEIHNITAGAESIEGFISTYEFIFIEMFGENNYQYI